MSVDKWRTSVEEELQKNLKLKIADIEGIQSWIKNQANYPKISDNQVILFLHAGGYDIVNTKKLIENYYTMRTQYTHYFSRRDPFNDKINFTMDVAPCVMHGKDIYGRRILWSKLLSDDPNIYHPTTATKLMFMVLDIDQIENGTVPGYTLVLDGKGFGFSHAMKCSLSNGRQIVAYVQTAATVIIEKVYIINMTSASEKVITILRPFIRSELFSKVTLCSNKEKGIAKMYETIPKEVVPEDYDGDAPSIKILAESCKQKLKNYKDWFSYEETIRLTNCKKKDSITESGKKEPEIEESFKSLEID